MMTKAKRLQWVTTFLLLLVFSYLSVQRISGNDINKAYAKAISTHADVLNGKHFVATKPEEIKQKVFERLIDRFTGLANKQQELCNISEDSFNVLVNNFGAAVKTVQVNGDIASVIQLDLSELNTNDRNEVRNLLNIQNVHCRLVDVYNNVIFILTAHLS